MTLLNVTRNKSIVECTKDAVWGCGVALQDKNCLKKTEWTNQGIMGKILEEIREELSHLKQDLTGDQTDTSDTSSHSSSSDESGKSGDDTDTPNRNVGNIESMVTETSDAN